MKVVLVEVLSATIWFKFSLVIFATTTTVFWSCATCTKPAHKTCTKPVDPVCTTCIFYNTHCCTSNLQSQDCILPIRSLNWFFCSPAVQKFEMCRELNLICFAVCRHDFWKMEVETCPKRISGYTCSVCKTTANLLPLQAREDSLSIRRRLP